MFPMVQLFFRLFVENVFSAKPTVFLAFQPFGVFLFIFCAGVINALALSALKMNRLLHCSNIFSSSNFLVSPRPELNRWPRPYQGRALPAELQGQKFERLIYLSKKPLSRKLF